MLQSIFTHDGYNEDTAENNIALVKLKKRVKDGSEPKAELRKYIVLGDFVQPICLPSLNKIKGVSSKKQGCKFSGWTGGKSGEHYLVGHAAEVNRYYDCDQRDSPTTLFSKQDCISVLSLSPPKSPTESINISGKSTI